MEFVISEFMMLQRGVVLWLVTLSLFSSSLAGAEWRIPLGGNAYRTDLRPGNSVDRDGILQLDDAAEKYAVYFSVDRPCKYRVALEARGLNGAVSVSVGKIHQNVRLVSDEYSSLMVGEFEANEKGYVRVDIQRGDGVTAAVQIRGLVISSETQELQLDYVRNNDGNMFYWGRRGPSVHLSYQVPRNVDIRYAYSEVRVPDGQDPIGSYYMANGFAEGYFGIQVNSATERRVLFSVWSPFQTDNPRDIPKDQQIEALSRGKEVRIGEFGNEGSGGQSYLIYPWVAGKTYRFLTEVKPDGNGSTVYTSWFGDKAVNEWRLIASFRRPKTDTHLKGFHSFLESFNPTTGYIGRRCENKNIWVVDTNGMWHECLQARFSVDPTGGNRHRLDYKGGAEGEQFFMQNCGFFNETGKAGEVFQRTSTADQKPEIDFAKLPRDGS